MLTADLVDARKKDGELLLRAFDREAREEALSVSAALLDAARSCVGKRREELDEAWNAITSDALPKHVKMVAGLRKLALDACSFEAEDLLSPTELRRVLFTRASEVRRTLEGGQGFDRREIVADVARQLGTDPDAIERALFSDLRSEHVLRAPPTFNAEGLVEAWELGRAQAILLTAVRVTIDVTSASAGLVRRFFTKLKFHRLLFSAERTEDGWRVVLDGPYSMFDAVTKYGLKLALVLPALRELERWSLVANVKWGKLRESLVFRLSSGVEDRTSATTSKKRRRRANDDVGGHADDPTSSAAPTSASEPHLADEVRELAGAINALDGAWNARPATAILDVPGQGVCIPDLELSRKSGAPVYVEVLGYWSRDAVFRRVELAERGLGARVVFAVSSRLRVSAEVLDDTLPSSLYVYKGKMSPRAIVDHATRLADRT